jgi:hypothetical protein
VKKEEEEDVADAADNESHARDDLQNEDLGDHKLQKDDSEDTLVSAEAEDGPGRLPAR